LPVKSPRTVFTSMLAPARASPIFEKEIRFMFAPWSY
jgi:hypothetical protein